MATLKQNLFHVLVLILAFLVLRGASAEAATINIDTDITGPVYGNGAPPNGADPANNEVIINRDGTVSQDIYGGYAYSNTYGDSITARGIR